MTEPGVIIAILSLISGVLLAVLAWVRFRRKDRADTKSVEEGTISARFKDADALMRYIDDRVDERTKALSQKLAEMSEQFEAVKKESHEIHEAVRHHFYRLWEWDVKGRIGPIPMLPPPILTRLGITDPLEDTDPIKETS